MSKKIVNRSRTNDLLKKISNGSISENKSLENLLREIRDTNDSKLDEVVVQLKKIKKILKDLKKIK